VKISLVDFAWETSQNQNGHSEQCDTTYGQVHDQATNVNKQLCGGRDRKMSILESAGHTVKVEITDAVKQSGKRFLIQYQGKYINMICVCKCTTLKLQVSIL
jgi:hypothetical protein